MTSTPTEYTLDIIQAMRKQEEKAYRIPKVETQTEYNRWRTQMVEWCYRTAEANCYQKESVEIAMSLLARYVAINTDLMTDFSKFQMACMACMYVSLKTQVDYKLCLTPRQMEHL
jgi:hypothetical protein